MSSRHCSVFPEIAENFSNLLLRLEQSLKWNARCQFHQNCCFLDWTKLAVASEQNSRFSLVYQVNAPFKVSINNGVLLCVCALTLAWLVSRMTSPLMAGVHGKKMLSFYFWQLETPRSRFHRCFQGIAVNSCCIDLCLVSCAGSAAWSFQSLALFCVWYLAFVLLSYHSLFWVTKEKMYSINQGNSKPC